jgi:hypothetical protein
VLYAGKPNWGLLATITPRWGEMPYPSDDAGARDEARVVFQT